MFSWLGSASRPTKPHSSILCTSLTQTPDQLGPALLRGSLLIYMYIYIHEELFTNTQSTNLGFTFEATPPFSF